LTILYWNRSGFKVQGSRLDS